MASDLNTEELLEKAFEAVIKGEKEDFLVASNFFKMAYDKAYNNKEIIKYYILMVESLTGISDLKKNLASEIIASVVTDKYDDLRTVQSIYNHFSQNKRINSFNFESSTNSLITKELPKYWRKSVLFDKIQSLVQSEDISKSELLEEIKRLV